MSARPIYLDYCATTPVCAEVRTAMLQALGETFGNPSSLHWAGQAAARLVEQARAQVAASLACQPAEVVFTSGATEADNLALFGTLRQYAPGQAHLITATTEHHAILHAAQQLEREGYAVTYVPVDRQGLVDPEAVRRALRPETVLISVMLVNNEVGAIQPVAALGALAHQHGASLHTDAVQGLGLLDINVDELQADLLSLSAHKIYGPKGIGALYMRAGTRLKPVNFGGVQEAGWRAGTENVPGIVGLGAAVEYTGQHKAAERERLGQLRQTLLDGLRERVPGLLVNGPLAACAPHVLSVSFPQADGEMLLMRLNMAGLATSMGSACTSKSIEPSHVLTAMGLRPDRARASIRFSLGKQNTADEVEFALGLVPETVARLRELSPLWKKSELKIQN